MTLPFDLGVEISRSESEIALSQECDGRLTWNGKDVSHPFMTMILTSVTIESTKTMSLEDVSIGVLEKIKNI